mgnify:CR=1 FL=1
MGAAVPCSRDCTYMKGAIPHAEGCPNRGARNGKSGKHTTPRASVPTYTADACVELGKLLGCAWQDAPTVVLERLKNKT